MKTESNVICYMSDLFSVTSMNAHFTSYFSDVFVDKRII